MGGERVATHGQGVVGEVVATIICAGNQIVRANIRKPGAPINSSKAGSRFSSAKTNPALA